MRAEKVEKKIKQRMDLLKQTKKKSKTLLTFKPLSITH